MESLETGYAIVKLNDKSRRAVKVRGGSKGMKWTNDDGRTEGVRQQVSEGWELGEGGGREKTERQDKERERKDECERGGRECETERGREKVPREARAQNSDFLAIKGVI